MSISGEKTFSSTPLNLLPVKMTVHDKRLYLTACLSPLHNTFSEAERLIEWLELNMLLGVQFFTVFLENATAEVGQILRQYEQKRILEVLRWDIPVTDIHYHGQLAAINDCLYRNKHRTKLLMITDVDEFIIPQNKSHQTIQDMINTIGEQSIYMFRHTRFYELNKTGNTDLHYQRTITQRAIHRQPNIDTENERSKLIVATDDIVTLGIHQIWATNSEISNYVVDPDIGLLHHYREGELRDFVENTSALKYKKELNDALQKAYKDIGYV